MPEHPTLAAVLADRSLLEACPNDYLPKLLLQLAAVQAEYASLQAAIIAHFVAANGAHEHATGGDTLLTVRDVAKRIGMSEAWVYRNAQGNLRLVATRPSGRSVRFSERGLARWIEQRRRA